MQISIHKNRKSFFAVLAFCLFPLSAFCAGFQFGGLRNDITSFPAALSTRIINSASTQYLRITGTATAGQVITLPDATTLQAGYWYTVTNESAGPVTVSNSASTQLCITSSGTASAAAQANLYLSSNSTTGGPWGCTLTTPAAVGCVALTGSNPAINWAAGNCFTDTIGANSTITFSNPSPGQVINMRFTNTGSFTLAWPTTSPYQVKWPTGTAPTLTTGAHSDNFSCWFDNVASLIWCNSVQNY